MLGSVSLCNVSQKLHLRRVLNLKINPLRNPCFFGCPIYNGRMLEENKNLKDVSFGTGLSLKDNKISISYTKTNKLITGLYMVTDTIETNEPIRLKLRTLGIEILSDIESLSNKSIFNLDQKIKEVMSFLEIAGTVHLISTMNFNILKKEFFELKQAVNEYTKIKPFSLEDFLSQPDSFVEKNLIEQKNVLPNGRQIKNGVGLQKGSTLMTALKNLKMSDKIKSNTKGAENFNLLKQERRTSIISIIKNKGGNATITDIKNSMTNISSKGHESSSVFSEKTLQRELISMVKDGVLYKAGEKRWSRYFIKN